MGATRNFYVKYFTWKLAAVVALVLWSWNAFRVEWVEFAKDWNTKACALEKTQKFPSPDCRHYYVKALFAYQSVYKGDGAQFPSCVSERDASYFELNKVFQDVLGSSCRSASGAFQTFSQKIPDLGWDAYALWYGRATFLYFEGQRQKNLGACSNDFSCLWNVAIDSSWIKKFPNREHYHYPLLLPFFYASVMTLFSSVNPQPLQLIQLCIFLLCAFLYWKTRGELDRWRVIFFSFIPMSGFFVFRLYAEIWIIFCLLFSLHLFDRRRFFLSALPLALLPWIKAEGFFAAGCFGLMYFWSIVITEVQSSQSTAKSLVFKYIQKMCVPILFLLGSSICYLVWKAPLHDKQFWIPLADRLAQMPQSLNILLSILGYFLDVLFRPGHWVFLWPAVFYFLIFKRNLKVSKLPSLIVSLMLVACLMSFWQFPFGHKEIVLTASGRALWMFAPMIWVYFRTMNKLLNFSKK